ncbi:unnamed protein product [Amoebophrya sp. A25]|nr:unnamed protein product [Amoebophrya sp. A25]|eukprot:GSA25T00026977001.1
MVVFYASGVEPDDALRFAASLNMPYTGPSVDRTYVDIWQKGSGLRQGNTRGIQQFNSAGAPASAGSGPATNKSAVPTTTSNTVPPLSSRGGGGAGAASSSSSMSASQLADAYKRLPEGNGAENASKRQKY